MIPGEELGCSTNSPTDILDGIHIRVDKTSKVVRLFGGVEGTIYDVYLLPDSCPISWSYKKHVGEMSADAASDNWELLLILPGDYKVLPREGTNPDNYNDVLLTVHDIHHDISMERT